MDLLKLSGISHQSGSSLAVVNGRVVSEGDRILDFKIETIGVERVWVNGPNGREQIIFDYGAAQLADFDYRVVEGATNNVMADPSWELIRGTVMEKLSDKRYRVSRERTHHVVVVKNVPGVHIDGYTLSEVCKYVGSDSYEARTGDKKTETVEAYDYGLPCGLPQKAVDRLATQKGLLLQKYDEATVRRAKFDIEAAEGVPTNEKQARRWLEKSGAQGNKDAQAALQAIDSKK